MTVIAWDGKTLAADSQSTSDNNTTIISDGKIWVHGGLLFGATGSRGEGLILAKWYIDGAVFDKYPVLPGPHDIDTDLIVVTQDEIAVYYESPIPCPFSKDMQLAWGSGAQAAMGAMAHGATAAQACEAACAVNVYCGLPVISLSLLDENT